MTTWMQYRIRTRWLSGNLPLILLRLLRDTPMERWEMLAAIYRFFGAAPDEEALGGLIRSLLGLGCIQVSVKGGMPKFRIASPGLRLLHRLEDEYRAVLTRSGSISE